jgi:hypothetical protein
MSARSALLVVVPAFAYACGSSAASGGDGGVEGGAPRTCTSDQKNCNGVCVSTNDPTYGCAAAECALSRLRSRRSLPATVACARL